MVSPFGNPGSHEGPIAIKTNAKTHKALQTERSARKFPQLLKISIERITGMQALPQ
jgi:hypothetical protein